MYGYPKTIATRHDIDMLMTYLGGPWATEENRRKGLRFLRGLVESAQSYTFSRVLSPEEPPDGPVPEYIVLEQEDGSRRQECLVADPHALIYRIGCTVAEVEALVAVIMEAE